MAHCIKKYGLARTLIVMLFLVIALSGFTWKVGKICFGGASEAATFNWTTSEQVWPFYTDNGDTIYAKFVSCGSGPNNGTVTDAHGITNFDRLMPGSLLSWEASGGGNNLYAYTSGSTHVIMSVDNTNVNQWSNGDYSGHTFYAYLLYTKTGD